MDQSKRGVRPERWPFPSKFREPNLLEIRRLKSLPTGYRASRHSSVRPLRIERFFSTVFHSGLSKHFNYLCCTSCRQRLRSLRSSPLAADFLPLSHSLQREILPLILFSPSAARSAELLKNRTGTPHLDRADAFLAIPILNIQGSHA